MPLVAVTQYRMDFNPNSNTGHADVQLAGGGAGQVPINSMEEHILVLLMLSKTQVMYDTVSKGIGFNWRPVGT